MSQENRRKQRRNERISSAQWKEHWAADASCLHFSSWGSSSLELLSLPETTQTPYAHIYWAASLQYADNINKKHKYNRKKCPGKPHVYRKHLARAHLCVLLGRKQFPVLICCVIIALINSNSETSCPPQVGGGGRPLQSSWGAGDWWETGTTL